MLGFLERSSGIRQRVGVWPMDRSVPTERCSLRRAAIAGALPGGRRADGARTRLIAHRTVAAGATGVQVKPWRKRRKLYVLASRDRVAGGEQGGGAGEAVVARLARCRRCS
jgi:hypothetical protein